MTGGGNWTMGETLFWGHGCNAFYMLEMIFYLWIHDSDVSIEHDLYTLEEIYTEHWTVSFTVCDIYKAYKWSSEENEPLTRRRETLVRITVEKWFAVILWDTQKNLIVPSGTKRII